jgi:hypothetical protein
MDTTTLSVCSAEQSHIWLDRALVVLAGPNVCVKIHSYHRFCVGAPAPCLDVILYRYPCDGAFIRLL